MTPELVDGTCLIGHETEKEPGIQDVKSFLFGDMDKDDGRDDDAFYFFLTAIAPLTYFVLGGYVRLVTKLRELVAGVSLCAATDNSHIPVAFCLLHADVERV